METWDTWTQVRCDSLDLFQISVDCDITDASASDQLVTHWLVRFISIFVLIWYCWRFIQQQVSWAQKLSKSKIYNHLEEKGGVLTLPRLNSRGSRNFDMLQPIFKSLSQSFLAQRNKTRSHHKNCWELTTHKACAPFYVFMTSTLTPRAFVQRLGNFSK